MCQEVEIIVYGSILSLLPVSFHTFCIDDNISLSKAQTSASQFYTPAHSMYQEVETIVNDTACFLCTVPVLFDML